MNGNRFSEDRAALTHWGGKPIYATTILTLVYAVGLLLSVLLETAGVSLQAFGFYAPQFFSGAVWQPVTYTFIAQPNFFTLFSFLCLYMWAVEIERFLGRGHLWKLYALLVLVQPLVASLWWGGFRRSLMGNYELVAAFLIGFATLYPNIEFLGWIPLKWFAFACFTIGSLMFFPAQDWPGLSILWATCGAAFAYIRWVQRGGELDLGRIFGTLFRRRPRLSVVREKSPPRKGARTEDENLDSVDLLLDKIAKSGMASLTPRERATLERAREALMKKEPGGE